MLADLGLALARTDIPRADAVLTEAIENARAFKELRLEARAGVRRVFVRLLLDPESDQADALREVEGYAGLFEDWSDDQGLAEARSLIGAIRFWQGAVAVGEENFERAIVHAQRAGDRRQEAEIVRWLTLVIDSGPTPADEGIRRLESLLDQSHGIGGWRSASPRPAGRWRRCVGGSRLHGRTSPWARI